MNMTGYVLFWYLLGVKLTWSHAHKTSFWYPGLDISAHALDQASVQTVRQVQVVDHLPSLGSMIIISRIYYSKY